MNGPCRPSVSSPATSGRRGPTVQWTARSNMMLGQLLAGMAFSNSSVALVHGMARPIGAFFHVAHGISKVGLAAP